MLYQNLHVLTRALIVIDSVTLGGCVLASWKLDWPAAAWEGAQGGDVFVFAVSLAAAFVLVSLRLDVYHTRRVETLGKELFALTESGFVAIAVTALVMVLVGRSLPSDAYAVVAVSGSVVLIAARLVVRLTLRRLRSLGRDYRAWMLVGRNPRSAALARDILANPHYGIRILGVVDAPQPDGPGSPASAFAEPPLSDLPFVEYDDPASVRDLVKHQAIDEVIITLPLRSFYDEVEDLVRLCSKGGVSVKLPTHSFPATEGSTEVVQLGESRFVTHFSGPNDALSLAVKRAIDLAVASVGLVLVSPLMLAAAIAVKLNSPGPVFFRQTRVGLNGRLFTLLKFRTMVADAEHRRGELASANEADGPVFKMRADPRITRVGRVLRRYYIDELPQLVNVFLAEMSLVGPRPPVPEETDRYEWWQRRRLSMPPGMTCLWQVASEHHDMPFERWMELDLQYIDRWSLGLDLRLLFATVSHVVRGQGW
jgi:exopolysaccharide biosynthesis polyprenyl glycosylphosphotransferase